MFSVPLLLAGAYPSTGFLFYFVAKEENLTHSTRTMCFYVGF